MSTLKITAGIVLAYILGSVSMAFLSGSSYMIGRSVGSSTLLAISAAGLWFGLRGGWWATLIFLSLRILAILMDAANAATLLAAGQGGDPSAHSVAGIAAGILFAFPLVLALIFLLLPQTRREFKEKARGRT